MSMQQAPGAGIFEFRMQSRSSWKKSLAKARQLVFSGKMSLDEFTRVLRPSPDKRDREPDEILRNLTDEIVHHKASAEAAQCARQRQAEVEEEEARRSATFIAQHVNVRCWHIAGFYIEDLSCETYTLTELRQVWDWAGPVVCEHLIHGTGLSALAINDEFPNGVYVQLGTAFHAECNAWRKLWSFDRVCSFFAEELLLLSGLRT